jgi:hypothetical protein
MPSTPAANYMLEGDAGLAHLVNLVIANVVAKSPNESAFAQWIREIKRSSMNDAPWAIVYHEAYLRLDQMYQDGGWAR